MSATFTSVGVWNHNICYLAAPIPISHIFGHHPYIIGLGLGCQRFHIFVGTRMEEEI